jgi:drug/metabolite transporter (DMT)-like permease
MLSLWHLINLVWILFAWQIIVFSRVITAHIFLPFLLKRLTGLNLSLKRLVWWQFLFCFAFSLIYALIFGFTLKHQLLMVAGIGFFNSLGAYCQWQAVKMSLSKTSLFTQADDIIGMSLGYWLLNETKYLTKGLVSGIVLCFGAAGLLISGESNIRLIKYVGIYSVIWGVASFLERYFAITGISFSEFLVSWYGGTLIGISCILFFFKEEGLTIKVPKKEIMGVGVLAIVIWLSMYLGYWAAKLAPITVYQPIFLVSEAVLPTLIGLLIFKEIKTLRVKTFIFHGRSYAFPIEKFAFLLGLAGITAIAISFR